MKAYKIIPLPLIALLVVACDNKNNSENNENSKKLVEGSLINMVAVKSGEFLMGDFGPLVDEELPFSRNSDDKKLHKVVLSDFMISKYKVTYDDYEVYRVATNGKPLHVIFSERFPKMVEGNVSASVTWQQAKDYCLWLGNQSGKKVDLPTEAQWEYAARSEGKYYPYATDNGKIEKGRNYPTDEQRHTMTGGLYLPIYPIGLFPPNQLGLYDMGLSGSEWTNDWYAADYYEHSSVQDPQGPEQGVKKVLRGYIGGDFQYALTILRQSALPVPVKKNMTYEEDGIFPNYVFRCVVNL